MLQKCLTQEIRGEFGMDGGEVGEVCGGALLPTSGEMARGGGVQEEGGGEDFISEIIYIVFYHKL